MAVTDTAGSVKLHVPEAVMLPLSSSLVADFRENTVPIEVPAKSLDLQFAETELASPLLIKVDVEGAELKVLEGARGLINKYRPIFICEILDAVQQQHLNSFFEALNYKGQWLSPLKSASQGPISAREYLRFQNHCFIPRELL